MYNCITWRDQSIVWITEAEKDYINHKLLNGEKFFDIPRTGKVYNSDLVASVGVPSIFSLAVEGSEFRFTKSGQIFSRSAVGITYVASGGEWVPTLDVDFDNAITFEELLA